MENKYLFSFIDSKIKYSRATVPECDSNKKTVWKKFKDNHWKQTVLLNSKDLSYLLLLYSVLSGKTGDATYWSACRSFQLTSFSLWMYCGFPNMSDLLLTVKMIGFCHLDLFTVITLLWVWIYIKGDWLQLKGDFHQKNFFTF